MGGEIECAARQTLELRRSTNRAKKDRTGAGRMPATSSVNATQPRGAPRDYRDYAVSRRSASSYFSLVCWITCAGSCGPGAVLFQSSVSR